METTVIPVCPKCGSKCMTIDYYLDGGRTLRCRAQKCDFAQFFGPSAPQPQPEFTCENCVSPDICKERNYCDKASKPLSIPSAPSGSAGQEPGIARIAAERQRQVEKEGWTPQHDDEHVRGELSAAAACYADIAAIQESNIMRNYPDGVPRRWPWDEKWWKPSPEPIRNLEKAGALIAAEIDRLQREKKAKREPEGRAESPEKK